MLFHYKDYKTYLNKKLDDPALGGRGARARFARAIGCQSAYTSHVLKSSGHFNWEQGEAINEFLGHTEAESEYFLLLIQQAKAGTKQLKNRITRQIVRIQEDQNLLKNRLGSKESLSAPDQSQYYSSWAFGAVHALVSVPGYQSTEAICQRLDLPPGRVIQITEFLLSCGLLVKEKGLFKIGKSSIHLGSDSDLISKHHTNWRLKILQTLEHGNHSNLNYSSVVTVSKADFENIKDILIESIKTVKKIIPHSKEEELVCFSIDCIKL